MFDLRKPYFEAVVGAENRLKYNSKLNDKPLGKFRLLRNNLIP
jgi:hypothetical protein